ncbi:MAG: class I SAM-dependent methyltransferase [Candidatus Eisenbacteria bacterium]|nr:class I SAM-dependent methyltransferase [Candidatus Eisenbacteria bacterium]
MRKANFGGIARCPVCGDLTLIRDVGENLRETCRCVRCGAGNRHRQMALVIVEAMRAMSGVPIRALREMKRFENFTIYNTEAEGPVHAELSRMSRYLCSEYYGDSYKSGDRVNGVMHQDLQDISFDDGSIDMVLSSDVFEHIPLPYRAHEEVFRVLRNGGRHIFTVPFLQTECLDDDRAVPDDDGNIVHLKEPMYHGDPIRSEGALVFKIFGLEMLVRLREIGFRTRQYRLRNVRYGILGDNAIVFEAVKP